jgi:hypothetical protein
MGGPAIERIDPFDGALGFSLVVRAGSTVYTAGAFGMDPRPRHAPGDEGSGGHIVPSVR